eukprot:Pgem_evm1s2817
MKLKMDEDFSSDEESDFEMDQDLNLSSFAGDNNNNTSDKNSNDTNDSDDDEEGDDESGAEDEGSKDKRFEAPSITKQKGPKDKLYALPTGDELRQLEETQNLYKSNLFRMQ